MIKPATPKQVLELLARFDDSYDAQSLAFKELHSQDNLRLQPTDKLVGPYVDKQVLAGYGIISADDDWACIKEVCIDAQFRRRGLCSQVVEYTFNKFGTKLEINVLTKVPALQKSFFATAEKYGFKAISYGDALVAKRI
jgi:hypothetical protein